MTIDQTPAIAWVEKGSYDNHPPHNKPPSLSMDVFLEHGSWTVLRQALIPPAEETLLVLWRTPDATGVVGDLWTLMAQNSGVKEWVPEKASGWFLFDFFRQIKQYQLDLEANRRPLILNWGQKWRTPGGTQMQSPDNGCIVMLPNGDRYEIQGLARINDDVGGFFTIAGINARAAASVAAVGHYRCDGISFIKAGQDETKVRGSQGPKSKLNGLIGPRYFREFIPDFEARYVLPNVAFGPKAKAVPPGWVEHPKPGQPYADQGGVIYPEGNNKDMVPCYTGSCLLWTDAKIQEWLDWLELPTVEGVPAKKVRQARYSWAINVRGWKTDADEPPPEKRKTRIRLSESGTGVGGFESEGVMDPATAAEFAKMGVVPGVQIGRGALRFAKMWITAGLPTTV